MRSRFYWAISGLILLIVFVGFARTFFLRPLFEVSLAPTYAYVHGAFMTAWYVLFFVQPSLVGVGRADIHRKLGIVTAIVGVGAIISAAYATLEFPARVAQRGGLSPESISTFHSQIVWGDSANVLFFTVFLGAAIVCRKKIDVHKRLMMLASISMISEAALRIGRFFEGIPNGSFATATVLLLLLAMIVHDYVRDGRFHAVTLVGGILFFLVARLYIRGVVATSEFGRTVVLSLAGIGE
jgi:hypothetical protein